ncbi:MAG: polysaccharide pyruvyl transferase family protein, partial [bacterium]|nr:polysaccharide pyruvyl transferase family protein [bacterium]
MRVGILTFHHVANYGAMLQAYALQEAVQELGHEVELIDYRPAKALAAYYSALFENNPQAESNARRLRRMEEFMKARMRLSPQPFRTYEGFEGVCGRYDVVIVGSDEVWNINSFRGYDRSYFLAWAGTERRVSYAASFGYTASTGVHREEIRGELEKFAEISVRDEHSRRIVEEECGLEAEIVVDPTLLIEYDGLVRKVREGEYMLVYGVLTKEAEAYVKRCAERSGVGVVAVGYGVGCAEEVMAAASPDEFVSLFAHARYVFTGFFHGIMFAVKFGKPFTAFCGADKRLKMTDAVKWMGLE